MLDVEFLASNFVATRPVLYRYRTGVHRVKMKLAIRQRAHSAGKGVVYLPYYEPAGDILTGNLFAGGSSYLFDLGERVPSGKLSELIANLTIGLAERTGEIAGFFVGYDVPANRARAWKEIEKSCLLVEEPVVTARTRAEIFRYLMKSRRSSPGEAEESSIYSNWLDRLDEGCDLAEAINAFDTVTFAGMVNGRAASSGTAVPHSRTFANSLRDFVARPSSRALADLVVTAGRLLEHDPSGTAVLASLVKRTDKIVTGTVRQPNVFIMANCLLWGALLIDRLTVKGHVALPTDEPMADWLDALGRTFIDQVAGQREAEIGAGQIAAGDAKGRLGRSVLRLVRALSLAVEARDRWSPLAPTQSGKSKPPVSGAPRATPVSVTTVTDFGQRTVAADLFRGILADNEPDNVLLVGSDRTAKRVLAKVFTKASQCTVLPSARPCNTCDACIAFDQGRAWTPTEPLDASHSDFRGLLPHVLAAAAAPSLGSQSRVITIENVDRCAADTIEVLLKTLEEPRARTYFVLLADDFDEVPGAVASRCHVLEVHSGGGTP